MVYSDKHKYIYLRPPKTASRSVQRVLRNHCEGKNSVGPHMLPVRIEKALGMQKYRNYFKFTIVRNPWDHTVSYYFWACKQGWGEFKDFADFVKNAHIRTFNMYFFHKGEKLIDYIGKMENLQESMEPIFKMCGKKPIKMPMVGYREVRNRDYRYYYNGREDLIEAVRQRYGPEMIQYLGYEYGE